MKTDTGWIILSTTYGAQYRIVNGICFVRVIYNGVIADGTLVGTLPAQFVPNERIRCPNYSSGSLDNPICLEIRTDGTCIILGAGNKWINLTASYPI